MTGQSYTHRDLARLLGVSETTVKSYRSKFPAFLPVARAGKPVRLHLEALEVCRRIRDLFADGLSIAQTADVLRLEFKEYPLNRRLSMSGSDGIGGGLGAKLETLTQAQEQTRRRMEQLEAEVRNLATLEAASKALVAELLQELRAARASASRPAPAPSEPAAAPGPKGSTLEPSGAQGDTVVTARKIVTVHSRSGPAASYALDREPRAAPPFAPPAQPDAAFLDLPAVIRSERGEFLGLPGGQSVLRLVEALRTLAGNGGEPAVWFEEGADAWTCVLPLGPGRAQELLFERTTTPRGNLVGLIRSLHAGGAEASPTELQEVFRQARDLLG